MNTGKTLSPRQIKYKHAEQILNDAGYQTWPCHSTRIAILAMLYIACNQIAAAKGITAKQVYDCIYMVLCLALRGNHFDPRRIRANWARAQRGREREEGEETVADKCPVCGRPVAGGLPTADQISAELLGELEPSDNGEVPPKITPPGGK